MVRTANVTTRIQSAVEHALSCVRVRDGAELRRLEYALRVTLEDDAATDTASAPASFTRKTLGANLTAQFKQYPELKPIYDKAILIARREYNRKPSRLDSPLSASTTDVYERMRRLAGALLGEGTSEQE